MKKLLVSILLILSSLNLLAGEYFSGGADIGAGILETGDETQGVLQLKLDPEFSYNKLSLGLKLAIYLTEDGLADMNGDGKENGKDIDYGFRYIDWDGDMFKLRYGEFHDYTLGHGGIVYRYSNYEKTSLKLGMNHMDKNFGMEVFLPLKRDIFGKKIDKMEQPSAAGGRVYLRPIKQFVTDEIPIVKNLELGISYAENYNNDFYAVNIVDDEIQIGDQINGKFSGIAYELSLPLVEPLITPYYNLIKYEGSINGVENDGNGNLLGIMGELTFIKYKFEYRNVDKNIKSGGFGKFYEANYNEYLNTLIYGEKEKISGYYGNVFFNLGELVGFDAAYEDYKGDDIKPRMYSTLILYPSDKLNGTITYEQENIGADYHRDEFLNEDTYIKAEITAPASLVGIPGPFVASIKINQTYVYNEEINDYDEQRIYSVNLGLVW